MTDFKYLGTDQEMEERELDTFPSPRNTLVRFVTKELTSLCPVTGHPDFNTLTIEYEPDELALESKSVKLYVETFRDVAAFCETLAEQIANDVFAAIDPHWVEVKVAQETRGGLQLTAISRREK